MGWFEDNLNDPPANGTPGMDSGRVDYGDFVTRPPLGTATGGGLNGPTAGALNPVTPPKTSTQTSSSTSSGGGASGSVADFVNKYLQFPWVANDPSYWIGVINANGGLSDANMQYWATRMTDPPGQGSNAGHLGGSGGGSGAFDEPPPEWQDYTPPGMGPNVPDIKDYQAPDPFTYKDYQAPDPFTYKDYQAPDPFTFDEFHKPDPNAVASDPAYQFRLSEGERALQASASARGTLRTGGTMKDINAWAQDFATQEYDKIYGRAMDEWRQKYDTSLGAYNANATTGLGAYNANRSNAADIYKTNADVGFNTYTTNRGNAADIYKTNADIGFNAWTANSGKAMDLWNANQKQFDNSVQAGQFATTTNNAGRMAAWAAKYGMSQDEIDNLIRYAGIGANAAAGTPSGRA